VSRRPPGAASGRLETAKPVRRLDCARRRPMNNRENKMALRKIVLLLLGIGLLLLVVCLTLSFYSYRTMPHFPRPETGYIYPLHLHETTVYVSELVSDIYFK
jgi:hypothetical protein